VKVIGRVRGRQKERNRECVDKISHPREGKRKKSKASSIKIQGHMPMSGQDGPSRPGKKPLMEEPLEMMEQGRCQGL